MKRYYPVIDHTNCYFPSATVTESPDGLYVLASEAQAEIDRLRQMIRVAYLDGVGDGWYQEEDDAEVLWMNSSARKYLTPTPNP